MLHPFRPLWASPSARCWRQFTVMAFFYFFLGGGGVGGGGGATLMWVQRIYIYIVNIAVLLGILRSCSVFRNIHFWDLARTTRLPSPQTFSPAPPGQYQEIFSFQCALGHPREILLVRHFYNMSPERVLECIRIPEPSQLAPLNVEELQL